MRSIEEYIKDAFKYSYSDIKNFIVGGLLFSISTVIAVIFNIYLLKYVHPYFLMADISKIIVLFVVAMLSLLIIGIITNGYLVRVMKTTVEGSDILPNWDNIVELFIKGLLFTIGNIILAIIFFVIPIILIALGIFSSIKSVLGLIFLILGFVILLISGIAYFFYSLLAEVNFSIKGFFGFFEFKKIFKMISLKYVVLVILIMIIGIIINIIVSLPFVLLSILLTPHQMLYSYSVYHTITPSIVILQLIEGIIKGFVTFFMMIFTGRGVALYYKDKVEVWYPKIISHRQIIKK
ncbi:DUF4013 domain-containing protein [Methanocaldococcus sp. 10A]